MATETTNLTVLTVQVPEPAPETTIEIKDQVNPQPTEQPPKASQPAKEAEPVAEKKPSGAELKKKAKEEKAARRAQAKAVPTSQSSGGSQAAAADGKPKAKPKQDAAGPQGGYQRGQQPKPVVAPTVPKDVKPKIPEAFSHLAVAKRINITQADKDVHPAVLMLGQHMSHFVLSDSITRLEATLLAFKQVIDDYKTPQGNTFSRHFTSHVLNPQIDYLTACRPMCFSMGNAIRWLKLQISKIDIDLSDSEVKQILSDAIDSFIDERINAANYSIVQKTANKIEQGSIILTYAHHHLVERALLSAKSDGKRFSVIVVDDPYEHVGLGHSKSLTAAGICVSYVSGLGSLRQNIRSATHVLVGAEAMFSNGAIYARAGTCSIATAANKLGIPVVALCETINFTERMSIDPLTYNEIDPERNAPDDFRLLFDTTVDKFVSSVVTELEQTASSSVPTVWRKLEDL